MPVIKIMLSLVIVLTSSLAGFCYGGLYGKRAQSLSDLEYCLRILESEVLIGNTPLPHALENVHKKGKGKIAHIFKDIKDDLIEEGREDIYYSFLSLSSALKNKYLLNKRDIEVLLFLGKVLGKTNRSDQEKNFHFIINEITQLSTEANVEKITYEKLYRSLGILLGISIIIIII